MPPRHRNKKSTANAKRRRARRAAPDPIEPVVALGRLLRRAQIRAAKISLRREQAIEKRKLRKNGLGSFHNPIEIEVDAPQFVIKVEEEEEDVMIIAPGDALDISVKVEGEEEGGSEEGDDVDDDEDSNVRTPGDAIHVPIKIDDAPPQIPALRDPGRRRGYEQLSLIGKMLHDFATLKRVAAEQDRWGKPKAVIDLTDEEEDEEEDESWIDDDGTWNDAIWVEDEGPERHGLLAPLREDQRVWMDGVITTWPHLPISPSLSRSTTPELCHHSPLLQSSPSPSAPRTVSPPAVPNEPSRLSPSPTPPQSIPGTQPPLALPEDPPRLHSLPSALGPRFQPPPTLRHEPPRRQPSSPPPPPDPKTHFQQSLCRVEFFGQLVWKPDALIRYVRFWAKNAETAYTNDEALAALQELHQKGCIRIVDGKVFIRRGLVRLDETPFLIVIED